MELSGILGVLEKYGIQCSVSLKELLAYLEAPSYEEDSIQVDDIFGNELLLLHEVAEICLLKKMGYRISRSVIMEAYPDTYQAHLEALNIELAEAENRGEYGWIIARCESLSSYLEDPYLPPSLKPNVYKLIGRYCNKVRSVV